MPEAPFRFAQIEKISTPFQPEGYRFLKPMGNRFQKWLAKQLWSGLHRLRALQPWFTTVTTYEYTQKAQDDLTKAIMHHIDYIKNEGGKIEDFAIIVGGEKFYELTNIMLHDNTYRTFPAAPLRFCTDDGREIVIQEYRGIPIHIVPHMSGIALVPKVILKRKEDDAPEHATMTKRHPSYNTFLAYERNDLI
jgi:hypothetical protein